MDAAKAEGNLEGALSAVRAKMVCNYIQDTSYHQNRDSSYRRVQLGAVYGTEGENSDYAKATPSGECWLQIDVERPAHAWFKPGKKYYLTFTEAPD